MNPAVFTLTEQSLGRSLRPLVNARSFGMTPIVWVMRRDFWAANKKPHVCQNRAEVGHPL